MDEPDPDMPALDGWVDALDRAEADLAAGRAVDSAVIHAELGKRIKRMEQVAAPTPTRIAAAK